MESQQTTILFGRSFRALFSPVPCPFAGIFVCVRVFVRYAVLSFALQMATHPAHIQTHQDRGACTFYGEIGRVCEPADISSPTRMSHGNRNNPNDALLRGSTRRIWTRFAAFSNVFLPTRWRDYCKSGNERAKLARANNRSNCCATSKCRSRNVCNRFHEEFFSHRPT